MNIIYLRLKYDEGEGSRGNVVTLSFLKGLKINYVSGTLLFVATFVGV